MILAASCGVMDVVFMSVCWLVVLFRKQQFGSSVRPFSGELVCPLRFEQFSGGLPPSILRHVEHCHWRNASKYSVVWQRGEREFYGGFHGLYVSEGLSSLSG